MPKISQAFNEIRLVLPSYPDSEVFLKNKLTVADLEEIEKLQGDYQRGLAMAVKMIVRWNFDEPIGEDNIRKLPAEDLEAIISNITAQKKN